MGERADEVTRQQPRIDTQESAPTSETVEGKDPEEIRQDIERTRAEMGETIDDIQERLSPENIKENVRQQTIGKAQEATHEASIRVNVVGSKIVERATPVLEQVENNTGPLGEQIRRGRGRYQKLQEDNPELAAAIPIGILVVLVLLWILLRRGSD
jgi:hypothetical protein